MVIDLSTVAYNIAAGQITNTAVGMEFSINSTNGSDGTWSACTAGNTTYNFATGGYDVWIRQTGNTMNNRKLGSIASQVVAPAHTINYIAETTNEVISATEEYSINYNFSGVANGTGTKIALTPGQNVYLRIKATASAVASAVQSLVVPLRPAVPAYSFDSKNLTTVQTVSASDEYSLKANMSGAINGNNLAVVLPVNDTVHFRTKAIVP